MATQVSKVGGLVKIDAPDEASIIYKNLIDNNDFSEVGPDIIQNGNFDTDTDWTKSANWSIADGKAISNGSGGNLQQSNVLTPNEIKTYLITYDIVDYVSGGVIPNLHGTISGTQGTAAGSYSVYITGISSTNTSLFMISNSFDGSIDNLSVKQVDPNDNWNNEGTWTVGDGYASGNGATGSEEELGQNISAPGILIGDTVKCSYEIKNYVSGSVQVIGISITTSRSVNGVYEFEGEITSYNIRLRGAAFNGDVANVIVYKMPERDITYVNSYNFEFTTEGETVIVASEYLEKVIRIPFESFEDGTGTPIITEEAIATYLNSII